MNAILTEVNLDLSKIADVELAGIDMGDAPDFCDAYIIEAWTPAEDGVTGGNKPQFSGWRMLTDAELDWLNEQREFVLAQVEKFIH